MRANLFSAGLVLLLALAAESTPAQTVTNTFTENFTGATSNNQWVFIGGACLTAGSSTSLASPGNIPSCATLSRSGNYYNETIPANPNVPGSVAFNTSNPFQPLLGGNSGTLPDLPSQGGALRLTNAPTVGGAAGYPNGLFERGAILSNFSFPLQTQGLQVTFTTETYDPSSCITPSFNQCPGGPYVNTDGADGISFFLQDATQAADIGAPGGALAYSCSNKNADPSTRANGYAHGFDGVVGGYLGVGIDEAGEFVNGAVITNANGTTTAWDGTQLFGSGTRPASQAPWGSGNYTPGPGPNGFDNTSTGFGWQPGSIGVRGAGSTAFSYLNATYPGHYPTSLTDVQRQAAVQQACTSGIVWDYSRVTSSTAANTNNATLIPGTPTQYIYNPYSATVVSPTVKLANYAAIAYSTLSGVQISNLSGNKRGVITPVTDPSYGVPITYNLSITPAGLLSLSYSYNGGAYQSVITGQNITTGNGPLPANVRFGFAGSMGGSQNTHEIMCFQATPPVTAGSSAGLNLKQSAQVQTGSQVYFAKYNPQTWAGYLTSQFLVTDASGNLSISSTVNWDASCVLTGGTCTSTGATGLSPQGATSPSRTMLSWSGSAGIPFEWANLTSAEETALNTGDVGDTSVTQQYRLNYLRGDRTQEQNSLGVGLYRTRASVLGDIIDSGPTWVGPPSATYPAAWLDTLFPTASPAENAGQTYPAFVALEQTRTNVVYAGANDGFLHGFRTGSYTAANVFNSSSTTNDGLEVLAYMPGYVETHIQTAVAANDYSSPQYGHHFDVDAPPGTGDLFYGGSWHTWLVGGLGAGGSAIYALDITDASNFSESNASSVVIGEWSSSPSAATATFACTGVSNASTSAAACGNNLGLTYGTPQIKRFHNGSWGVVFGNGLGSSTGDAGIYLMLVNPTSGARTFYYLGTGESGTGDGIANATAADFDGDHVVDYVYAGDLAGNVWRFDVTSSNPANWAVQTTPIFTTGTGQPITSKVIVALVPSTPSTRVMVEFGTGEQTQFSNTAGATYSGTQQYLYGVWDWNLASWNAHNSTQFGVLPITGFTAPSALSGTTYLVQQTITSSSSTTDYRTVSSNAICWADTAACSGSRQYGWYLALSSGYETGNANSGSVDVNLPTAAASATAPSVPVYEQVIYNPLLAAGAFIVNTTIPATNSVANCNTTSAGGWTMAINPATGGAFPKSFFNSTTTDDNSPVVNGVALSGTGTPWLVTSGNNTYLVTQTVAGNGNIHQVTPPAGTSGKRLTWSQKR